MSCQKGFYVHESGSCEKGLIEHCGVYNGKNQCVDCDDGYFLKSFFDLQGALIYKRCIVKESIGRHFY